MVYKLTPTLMLNQRDIREKALQSLFAHTAQKDHSVDECTWDLTLEPEQDKINKLSIKALKHQLSALPKRGEELASLVPVIAPMMKTYDLKSEARTLVAIEKGVANFNSQFSLLGGMTTEGDLTNFYHQAKALHSSLAELQSTLTSSSFTATELPKLVKVHKGLVDLTKRVDFISSPADHPEENSVGALVKAYEEQGELRQKASQYTVGVLENLESIDEALQLHLKNFSQEQIGRVELSLLRLGAYEIMVLKEPKGHVINDSLELARKFTTEDAVPLINGVLDKVG